jgi:hypothetical protein
LLVTILTENKIKTAYRFYGTRHSAINLGFKLDFYVEQVINRDLLRLRDIMHISFEWLNNHSKLLVWQQLCRIVYTKLKGAYEVDSFYYQTIEIAASRWGTMNAKRIAIETIVDILGREGKLDISGVCFSCLKKIETNVAFGRGFSQMHPSCAGVDGFLHTHIQALFEDKTSILLNDANIDKLWIMLLQGFSD